MKETNYLQCEVHYLNEVDGYLEYEAHYIIQEANYPKHKVITRNYCSYLTLNYYNVNNI